MNGDREATPVRHNLLTEKGYSPYCGNWHCSLDMPRTKFNGEQFTCGCGWVSEFPDDFMAKYKTTWNIT